MKRTLSVFAAMAMASTGVVTAVLASPAGATVVACGSTITVSTTLTADVGPCTGEGIRLGASGITLDLNGHRVFGVSDPGQGAGIVIPNKTGDTVKNGEIFNFDAGVAILFGSANTAQNLFVHDNIGSPDGDFGDGIAMSTSSNNVVTGNRVVHNGPFDGIGSFGASTGNKITSNVVTNNNTLGDHHGGPTPIMQDTGIRLENGTTNAIVTGNSVVNNGLDGIEIFASTSAITVQGNNVVGNGFNDNPAAGFRLGDGIRTFTTGNANTITSNLSVGNAANGIRIDSQNNQILFNRAVSNNAGHDLTRPAFDLADSNPSPPCDNNAWHGNIGITVSPPCTLNP